MENREILMAVWLRSILYGFGWLAMLTSCSEFARSLVFDVLCICLLGWTRTYPFIYHCKLLVKGRGGKATAETLGDLLRAIIPSGAGRQDMGCPSIHLSHEHQPLVALCWLCFWFWVQIRSRSGPALGSTKAVTLACHHHKSIVVHC